MRGIAGTLLSLSHSHIFYGFKSSILKEFGKVVFKEHFVVIFLCIEITINTYLESNLQNTITMNELTSFLKKIRLDRLDVLIFTVPRQ